MKIRRFLMTIAATVATMAAVAKTDGFSYQAVVRNAQNELVSNTKVGLRLTLTDQTGTPVFYQETQSNVATNAYGVLSVTVGNGTQVGNNNLASVDWTKDVFLKVEVDVNNGTNYTNMGSTKIQAVPVALYAARSGSSSQGNGSQGNGVQNGGTATADGDALFDVKDKDGNVVFAVYPNGVHVYIDPDADGSKMKRSGFLVTGRDAKKDGASSDYFAVNSDGTQVYVGEGDAKMKRSGFLVTGRDATKEGVNSNYFAVNDDGTQVYVGEGDAKMKRSGFLVTGRDAKKDGVNSNYFAVNDDGTQVFVGEGDAKMKRSGFLVTGRDAKKEGKNGNYLSIDDEGTKVYIDDRLENNAKMKRSGFLVTGRDATKGDTANYLKVATDGTQVKFDTDASKMKRSGFLVTGRDATKGGEQEYMTINTDSTRFYIDAANSAKGFAVSGREDGTKDGDNSGSFGVSGREGATSNLFNIDLTTSAEKLDSVNRIYWYPAKNAFMAGNLKVADANEVGTNSFSAGFQNTAKGKYSQALGYKSRANGDYTTAIGRKAFAKENNAYALGDSAQAKGAGSYAIGAGAVASGMCSFAIGSVGQDSLKNPLKAAKATGDYAYAIGAGTQATDIGALAMGVETTASYDYSTAIGYKTTASGKYSTAMGFETRASGGWSTAMGEKTKATSSNATAMGDNTTASGIGSTAMGRETTASGGYSTAMGRETTASGNSSTAMGYNTTAPSFCEVVLGQYNTRANPSSTYNWATSDRVFVIGNGKSDSERSNALIVYKNGNTEFRGNVYPSSQQNIYTENNQFTLGTESRKWFEVHATTFYGKLMSTSDKRLKTNIKPLEKALDKVLTLNGVTYEWRVKEFPDKHFDSDRHVGVLAQELEAVLPEAVETGADGYKSVNYSEITPLLIEAVKELKTIIDGQNKKIEELEKQIEELKK